MTSTRSDAMGPMKICLSLVRIFTLHKAIRRAHPSPSLDDVREFLSLFERLAEVAPPPPDLLPFKARMRQLYFDLKEKQK